MSGVDRDTRNMQIVRKRQIVVLIVAVLAGWFYYDTKVRDMSDEVATLRALVQTFIAHEQSFHAEIRQLEAELRSTERAAEKERDQRYWLGAVDMCQASLGFGYRKLVVVDDRGLIVAEGRCKSVARVLARQEPWNLLQIMPA